MTQRSLLALAVLLAWHTSHAQVAAPADAAGDNDKVGRPIVQVGRKTLPPAPQKETAPEALPVKVLPGTGTAKTKPARELLDLTAPDTSAQPGTFVAPGGGRNTVPDASSLPQEGAHTPPPAGGYPGLGTPPGMPAPSGRPVPIQAQNGVNEIVNVSAFMPNRISTPFTDAKVVDFSNTKYQVIGGDVYLVPKTKEPIGLFIRDNRPGSPTIALTLVPKQIPGVSILVNIEGGYASGASSAGDTEDSREEGSYEATLKKVMRRVTIEGTPSGYTDTALSTGIAQLGDVRIIPEKRYSGQNFDIYRYRLVNSGKTSLELSEETFYQKGVKAVAFFPLLRLDPWQSTKVLIVTGKSSGGADAD